ncbi:MAG: LPS ABC transporter substrate-binding protein LptA [Caulobacterales bacterium]|nr:LPS ABC transporter substrate-binding protein LptA [Caulobacterales bacterium]
MRNFTRRLPAALITAAAVAMVGPAGAQIAPGGGPVAYGADNSEYIDSEGVFRLIGRAEMIQGENRLRADTIDMFTTPNQRGGASGGDVREVVATGNVYFVTPIQVVRGDRAVYTAATDQVVITGDVILTQGENVMTGSRLTIVVSTNRATMDGTPSTNGSRVRGVFYPDESPARD